MSREETRRLRRLERIIEDWHHRLDDADRLWLMRRLTQKEFPEFLSAKQGGGA